MKYNEIMAAIQQLKNTVANLQCEIAALEELVANENHQEETPDETPVVNEVSNVPIIEEEVEEFSAPPAEIHIDVVEEKPKVALKAKKKQKKAPDEESIIGNQIISELKLDYSGKCDCITLEHPWYDNTGKLDRKGRVIDTLWMETHIVIITLEDINNKVLLTKEVHWDRLYKWHGYLLSKKISKGIPNPDPHKNGMPRKVHLVVGD